MTQLLRVKTFLLIVADFGVSAKNKHTMQKRDSFIGTPYWYVLSFVNNTYTKPLY